MRADTDKKRLVMPAALTAFSRRCHRWSARRTGVRLAAATVAVAVLALVPCAAMATGWAEQFVPAPSAAMSSDLLAVSCSAPSSCFAVGYQTINADQSALIERWNGTNWSVQNVQAPGQTSFLNGVSCPTSSFCMAVGSANLAGTGELTPLALTWNGAGWTQQTVPLHPAESAFQAVSCLSASFCEAVGWTLSDGGTTVADDWNGSGFTPQPTAGLPRAGFNGVSCASATFCIADGEETPQPGVTVPYVESYNGTSWSPQSQTRTGQFLVSPPNAFTAFLSGSSCPSANACQLVGISTSSPGSIDFPWAAGLSGRAWSFESAPPSFSNASLNDVSCATATYCWAVGQYTDIYRNQLPLGDYWNGSSWQLADINVSGNDPQLNAVACPTPRDCEAVGTSAPTGQAVATQYTFALGVCCILLTPHSFSISVQGREKPGATITAVLHKPRALVLLITIVHRHRSVAVGLVRLGNYPAGRSRIYWSLRVDGRRLPPGTYKLSLHSITGDVLSPATPPGEQTLVVRGDRRVRIRP
jgi:hypothetical protein